MQYNVEKLREAFPSPFTERENPSLVKGLAFPDANHGPEGAFFTKELPHEHPAVLDYNQPPTGQPSLWCHWTASDTSLEWNGAEKFYQYAEWLEYLVEKFFVPWGIQLNGAVQWQGEDPTDRGILSMRNNRLFVHFEDVAEGEEAEDAEEAEEEA